MFHIKIVRPPVCGLSGGDQPQWAGEEGEGQGLPCQVLQLSDVQVSTYFFSYELEGENFLYLYKINVKLRPHQCLSQKVMTVECSFTTHHMKGLIDIVIGSLPSNDWTK